MPRDLPVGNGKLLVNFDRAYNLSDIYYPHVGSENQTAGRPCRFGVWVDGQFSWLSDPSWERDMRYEPDTLVTRVVATNHSLGLRLTCTDVVDFDANIYVKRVAIDNLAGHERELRLFFHVDCHLGGTAIGNTAYFEPQERALVFYRECNYLWLGSFCGGKWGLADYSVGSKGLPGLDGTWRDAEDGVLGHNPIAQGSVDGVGQADLRLPANGGTVAYFWLAAGVDFAAVRGLHLFLKKNSPERFIQRTRDYWRLWVTKRDAYFGDLSPEIAALYRRSLLVLRTQIDENGAILAANDADILRFGMDTYSYMWPRDGALVVDALSRAGYIELPRRFFYFLKDLPTSDGCLLHKYNPAGSQGSSWQPWVDREGHQQLPIQEDETALPLYSLWRFYDRIREVEVVAPLYKPLIKQAADFLDEYRAFATNLPLPSYDLWEERRGVLSYTVGAVWAGLTAAANFTEAFGENEIGQRYRTSAEEIKTAALKHLYDPELGRFLRMIYTDEHGQVQKDTVIDASLAGLFLFGMLPADHPGVVATMKAVEEHLWCKTAVGGIARYQNDYYHQVSGDLANVPGNPWFICTLWVAQWHIQLAQSIEELARARELLEWTARHALPSGVLAEQVHPYDGTPLSVSPLTWSHAEFVSTVLLYAERCQQIQMQKLQGETGVGLTPFRTDVEGLVVKPEDLAGSALALKPPIMGA